MKYKNIKINWNKDSSSKECIKKLTPKWEFQTSESPTWNVKLTIVSGLWCLSLTLSNRNKSPSSVPSLWIDLESLVEVSEARRESRDDYGLAMEGEWEAKFLHFPIFPTNLQLQRHQQETRCFKTTKALAHKSNFPFLLLQLQSGYWIS